MDVVTWHTSQARWPTWIAPGRVATLACVSPGNYRYLPSTLANRIGMNSDNRRGNFSYVVHDGNVPLTVFGAMIQVEFIVTVCFLA